MYRPEMARTKKTKARTKARGDKPNSHGKKKKETKEDYFSKMEEKKRLEGKQ